MNEDKKYPMTYEEFKNRIFELFIERGNKKEDWHYFTDIDYMPIHEKKESLLECWYPQFCRSFDEFNENPFTDDGLVERIVQIELKIKKDATTYPMTYEEFEKRVIELFLESKDYTDATNEEKLIFLNEELLVNDPDFIKILYSEACYNYVNPERPNNQFTDEGLINQPVRILNMLY